MAFTCEEVRDRFSAFWEKTLNPSEEAEVKRHIEGCPYCREEFARFEKTLRMLHSVEEAEVPEGFLSGIYEKIEEREGKGFAPKKIPREGYARWKIPAQALAMVAIIFLAVYLTRMIPGESPKMKAAKPSTPAVKEEKWDRLQAPKELEKAEKKEAPGRLAERPGPVKTEAKQGAIEAIPPRVPGPKQYEPQPAAAPAPQKLKSDAGLTNKPAEERLGAREGAKGSGTLQQTVRASPGPAPSEEFVVKSSDREKSLSDLRQLIDRFGGETLTTEGNVLLVSLPGSSLREFRRELEEIGAPPKARRALSSEVRRKNAFAEREVEKEASQGKDLEIKALDAAKEARVIVRIVLSRETGESKD